MAVKLGRGPYENITQVIWSEVAEENIWSEEGWSDRRLVKKLHDKELHNLYS
jgi:hypothetical protein